MVGVFCLCVVKKIVYKVFAFVEEFSRKEVVKDKEPPCGEENKVVVEGGVKDDVAVLFEGFDIPFVWQVIVYDYSCYPGV